MSGPGRGDHRMERPGDSPSLRRPRLLLADDDAMVCRAVSRLLSPWCDVVGVAPDSPTLFDTMLQLRPEIVLLDLSLPGGLTGIEVCRRLRTMAPEVRVVVFTAHDDPELRRLTQEAGASAFVWKLRAPDELLPTIEAMIASKP